MPKLPFMKFYPGDWMRDTRRLTATTKGIWFDMMMFMWGEPERGVYLREFSEIAIEIGCLEKEVRDAVIELKNKGIANVSISGNAVSITSRRMIREEKRRKDNKYYQQLHRRKLSVSSASAKSGLKTLDVRSQTLEVRQLQQHIYKGATRFQKPTAGEVKDYAASIGFRLDGEEFIAHYESNGWLIGKASMKNWRAAVVTWKKKAPPSALIVKSVHKPPPVPDKPMTEEEQRQGLAFAAQLREALRGGAKEIPK